MKELYAAMQAKPAESYEEKLAKQKHAKLEFFRGTHYTSNESSIVSRLNAMILEHQKKTRIPENFQTAHTLSEDIDTYDRELQTKFIEAINAFATGKQKNISQLFAEAARTAQSDNDYDQLLQNIAKILFQKWQEWVTEEDKK